MKEFREGTHTLTLTLALTLTLTLSPSLIPSSLQKVKWVTAAASESGDGFLAIMCNTTRRTRRRRGTTKKTAVTAPARRAQLSADCMAKARVKRGEEGEGGKGQG